MKIAINALSAKTGGGLIYLNRLIFYLHQTDKENDYYIFVNRLNRNKIINFNNERFHVIEARMNTLIQRLLYEQFIIPFVVYKHKIDVLYSPAEFVTFFAPCKIILGIQNPNVYYKTKIRHSFKEKLRLGILKILAKISSIKVKRIIFVSQTAQKDITKILKIKLNKTTYIYHGIEINKFNRPSTRLFKNLTSNQKYILYVSDLARHKNCESLIKAYARLAENLIQEYGLVIVGKESQPYYNELKRLVEALNIEERVFFTGGVVHEELPAVYQKASLFVFPSILETFGIPLIEAMAAGCPIVASRASCMPEICQDAALYFDPYNIEDIKDKIEAGLSDNNLRSDLIDKGKKRAKKFSWEETARKTTRLFEEVNNIEKN